MARFNSSNRDGRAKIADSTIKILEAWKYKTDRGKMVDISDSLKSSIENTVTYGLDKIDLDINQGRPGKIEVTSETTLQAAKRLVVDNRIENVGILNFASAYHPGGGFINGSSAQEESLARSSGLYSSLLSQPEMYNYNKNNNTKLYSDYMVYSPSVPIFRDDTGKLLDKPYVASFITAPAVNKGALKSEREIRLALVEGTMKERIRKLLKILSINGNTEIVLGAFGCGVFKNDPSDVASYFKDILIDENYKQMFNKVVFAVYDKTPDKNVYNAFKNVFGN